MYSATSLMTYEGKQHQGMQAIMTFITSGTLHVLSLNRCVRPFLPPSTIYLGSIHSSCCARRCRCGVRAPCLTPVCSFEPKKPPNDTAGLSFKTIAHVITKVVSEHTVVLPYSFFPFLSFFLFFFSFFLSFFLPSFQRTANEDCCCCCCGSENSPLHYEATAASKRCPSLPPFMSSRLYVFTNTYPLLLSILT